MATDPAGLVVPPVPAPVAPAATRAELRHRAGQAKKQAKKQARRRARKQARWRSVDAIAPWAVAAVTLALRLATAAGGPTDWDSAQYASAVGHFDVTHGLPQPPGYWLYVVSGRLAHGVLGLGAVDGLVVVAALASAAGAGFSTLAGRDLGGRWVGLAAGAIVATVPFAWFSGSTVSTYSFDLLACSLLIVLAWRARPGSWHGVGAVVALGLLAGFRQSVVQSFLILALIAVAGSTRRWSRLAVTVVAGAASVAVWLVPMAMAQPGGLAAWARATRQEADGAAQLTSVLDHAPGGATNLGTFAAYTVVALGPLALVAAAGGAVLLARRFIAAPPPAGAGSRSDIIQLPSWTRPWYQGRAAILGAAIVPPVLLVSLVQFAKGGYLLAYLPAATIALLLPLGTLARRRGDPARYSVVGLVAVSLAVALVAGLGAQRFLGGAGVLPGRWVRSTGSLWLQQPRYQAPYPDTRAAIVSADAVDLALAGLAPSVSAGRDVVVFDMPDGGANIYRNAGWALPELRISLITQGAVVYNEQHGALYYASGASLPVGPGGSALLVASPALPGLARLTAAGSARPVATPRPIGGYRVWRLPPGVRILGVSIVEQAGPRSLGGGI